MLELEIENVIAFSILRMRVFSSSFSPSFYDISHSTVFVDEESARVGPQSIDDQLTSKLMIDWTQSLR